VASVKWLTEIEVIDHAFDGYFQTEKYVFERERDGQMTREPVTLQRVRALITDPQPDARIEAGRTDRSRCRLVRSPRRSIASM